MENLIDKYIQRIKVDYPEDDKLMIDLQDFAREIEQQLRIAVVGRWRFLNDRSDFEEMPKKGDFRCLFDDGTECNFFDEHPIAIMIAWKPL